MRNELKSRGAMIVKKTSVRFVALVMAALASVGLRAQAPMDSPQRSIAKGEAVEYLFPEQVSVPAGKASPVVLHFRIGPGLHINSHTPREEFLIPTMFSIPESSGVRLQSANYPAGSELVLRGDTSDKLNVYTGDFAIDARIIAPKGDHLVEAKLRYQACNNDTCMPPKTITVPIDVIGN
jgi:DsbC/DsbD-like thiol-disulfide interchange protein